MKSEGFESSVERVESMQWNRTIASRALEKGTQIELSFPPDIDPDVIERVREQIKQQVLAEAPDATVDEQAYTESDSD